MKGTNTVQLIGYVGKDLASPDGRNKKKTTLRIATREYFTDKEGARKSSTTWHDVVAWDELAAHAGNSFVKGSHILVQGRLRHYTFIDSKGHKRFMTEIVASHLFNLDR